MFHVEKRSRNTLIIIIIIMTGPVQSLTGKRESNPGLVLTGRNPYHQTDEAVVRGPPPTPRPPREGDLGIAHLPSPGCVLPLR